ncbi:uncharacterized protein BO66DRAFT_65687 [Aspergillus aculeatinus CBS 121060]|uniref:Uncharacterized protein n=1 Tax=Aspergillus aculeatinus CBS 121060 TaxID=1448322 RepID=A0ACD1HMS4_9EURO|nr:hypothetical protein BO66DRAFT_65687 [Aspergillus aculeatinus CBS 121060]RAH74762.1 hypothetical protein BO66DRAFT_65687 [Aspergillus aculeatinus CBS 121060]
MYPSFFRLTCSDTQEQVWAKVLKTTAHVRPQMMMIMMMMMMMTMMMTAVTMLPARTTANQVRGGFPQQPGNNLGWATGWQRSLIGRNERVYYNILN